MTGEQISIELEIHEVLRQLGLSQAQWREFGAGSTGDSGDSSCGFSEDA